MRRLVPEEFRPPEDNVQWNVPVAPVTLQSSIESGVTSPDDRYKLLGQENMKFCFSRLLSPVVGPMQQQEIILSGLHYFKISQHPGTSFSRSPRASQTLPRFTFNKRQLPSVICGPVISTQSHSSTWRRMH
jgi:hypothetical protein